MCFFLFLFFVGKYTITGGAKKIFKEVETNFCSKVLEMVVVKKKKSKYGGSKV